MPTRRPLIRPLLALLALGLAVPAAAAEREGLAGRVLDTLGNGIPRVEVLVLDRAAESGLPVATALSDAEGYFRVASLVPGAYRVAALKDGYLTFVGVVDTAARRSLQLVLQPAGGASLDGALPDDASWALRLPRRSILRETSPVPAVAASAAAAEEGPATVARVELDQSFGVPATVGRAGTATGTDSSDTRVRFALPLGERGAVELHGSRERHSATDAGAAVADRAGRALRVDVRYEALPGGQLDVNAFYQTREFSLASAAGGSLRGGLQQQQGSVGYDASWTQRLDERSEFAFGVDYSDVWLESPPAIVGAHRTAAGVGSRVVGAEGGYRRAIGAAHDLSLTVRARMLAWPQIGGIGDGPLGGRERRPDLDVAIDAEDRWSIAAPWTLVYGFGHRQSLLDDGVRVTRPRLGAIWAAGDWRVAAELSYHDVEGGPQPQRGRPGRLDRRTPGPTAAYLPSSDLGYEASVDVPLATGVSVHGRLRRAPVEFAHVRYDGPSSGNPIYLSDGAAAVTERAVSIVQASSRARASFELASGEAAGRLSAFVPFAEADEAGVRGVAFDSARVGVSLPTSGTVVALEYRRLVSEPVELATGSDSSTLRSLEMRLRKDLWDLASSGDWRLLVALSVDAFESDDLDRWREEAAPGDDEAFQALNRRISAGVSVAF